MKLADQHRSEHDRALAKSFKINDSDLKANREGVLSENQKRLLFRRQLFFVFLSAIMVIVTIGNIVILERVLPKLDSTGAGIGLWVYPCISVIGALFFMIMLGVFMRRYFRTRADIREGIVICETKIIIPNKVDSERINTKSSQAPPKATSYNIMIGGQNHSLNANLYNILKNDERYHVYYTKHTGVIVAMELAV